MNQSQEESGPFCPETQNLTLGCLILYRGMSILDILVHLDFLGQLGQRWKSTRTVGAILASFG